MCARVPHTNALCTCRFTYILTYANDGMQFACVGGGAAKRETPGKNLISVPLASFPTKFVNIVAPNHNSFLSYFLRLCACAATTISPMPPIFSLFSLLA